MNRSFLASMEFQRPDGGVPFPQPLCPVCRAPVEIYTVLFRWADQRTAPLSLAWRRSGDLRSSWIRATD